MRTKVSQENTSKQLICKDFLLHHFGLHAYQGLRGDSLNGMTRGPTLVQDFLEELGKPYPDYTEKMHVKAGII